MQIKNWVYLFYTPLSDYVRPTSERKKKTCSCGRKGILDTITDTVSLWKDAITEWLPGVKNNNMFLSSKTKLKAMFQETMFLHQSYLLLNCVMYRIISMILLF